MAKFGISVSGTAATSTGAYAVFKTAAGNSAKIRTIEAFNQAATISVIGVGRIATAGVTPVSSGGQAYGIGGPAATAVVESSWATSPTIPAAFFKRCQIAASAGTGMIWNFQQDGYLEVPVSSGIVLWNAGVATGPAMWINIDWEE